MADTFNSAGGGFNPNLDPNAHFGHFASPSLSTHDAYANVAPHVAIEVKERNSLTPALDSEDARLIGGDISRGQPPAFAHYKADFFERSNGDVVSHDPHLNEDGEALYQFLRTQSQKPPTYIVSLSGEHPEARTHGFGKKKKARTEMVTDFSFSILLTPYIVMGPGEYTFPDDVPAFRGSAVKQVLARRPGGREGDLFKRKAVKEEKEVDSEDRKEHEEKGIAPWMRMDGTQRWQSHASSWTMREWVNDYSSSKKILKEFVYTKKIYGWSTVDLESALLACVRGTGYTGETTINFELSASRIHVRPTNRLSRTLSKTWIKVLLIIFLIYPFIWLFKRFSRYGGGKWKVAGAMYGLKEYVDLRDGVVHLNGDTELVVGEEAAKPTLKPRLVRTENGAMKKLTGYREGEWFKEWENVVRNSVIERVQRDEPYTRVEEGPENPVVRLDGY